jgi:hypothetical protein
LFTFQNVRDQLKLYRTAKPIAIQRRKMVSTHIHKWAVRLVLATLVVYPFSNASIQPLDWTELANEIDNQQWCGKSDYCHSLYETDDESTTELFSIKHGRTTMNPSEMEEKRSVYLVHL